MSSDLIAALAKAGFRVFRVKGSHHFLRHEDGRSTVVPATQAKPSVPAYFTRSFAIAN
jgi:predicted RNA binding protein YcfA (HicA-like mRNA interferase family)